MSDVKIKVIDSDKLINAINEESYEIDLSAVMALGAVMSDTKKQESCEYCREDSDTDKKPDQCLLVEIPDNGKVREIGFAECANALLKMWIDNVVTDDEYNRIVSKLNKYWTERGDHK